MMNFKFNEKHDQPSKKMFLLEIYEEPKDYPADSIFFEDGEKMIEVVKDNLANDWTLKEYHPVWDEQFVQNLTIENILRNESDGEVTDLHLKKNEKFSDPEKWLLAQCFESFPERLRLVIRVIDVFY